MNGIKDLISKLELEAIKVTDEVLSEKESILNAERDKSFDRLDSTIDRISNKYLASKESMDELKSFRDFHVSLVDRVYADGFTNGVYNYEQKEKK